MKKRGIKFGSYHTGIDWNLILNSQSYTPPEPKHNYISVDGRNGDIDLSEALTGEITYENGKGTYKFIATSGNYIDRNNLLNNILKVLHGQKMSIISDDDVDHYIIGRCDVSNVKNTNAYMEFTVNTICDPWKYRILETVRTVEVNNQTKELSLVNDGVKTVIPELKVTGSINIAFDSSNVALSDGVYKLTSLKLKSGLKILNVSGIGTLTVTYREANLYV